MKISKKNCDENKSCGVLVLTEHWNGDPSWASVFLWIREVNILKTVVTASGVIT
jgi:hypothetical protein